MSSSLPDGFDVRFATDADAAAVAELARAVEDAVLGAPVITEGDIRDWWRVTEPGENVWLSSRMAHLARRGNALAPRRVPNVWGDVHPGLLGRGLGTALLALAEARAGELGAAAVRNDVFAQRPGSRIAAGEPRLSTGAALLRDADHAGRRGTLRSLRGLTV